MLVSPLLASFDICCLLSASISPLGLESGALGAVGGGLPALLPPRCRVDSMPMNEGEALVGGDVPSALENVGDWSGDGDLFWRAVTPEVPWRAAVCEGSRLGICSAASALSAFRTSANEMKLSRRMSLPSGAP